MYEVYSACSSRQFDSHIDLETVRRLANEYGMSVSKFRVECLNHMRSSILSLKSPSAEETMWLRRLDGLIEHIERDGGQV